MLAIRSVQKYFTTGLDLNAEVLLGVKIPPSIGSLLDFGIGRQVEVLIRCCHFLNPCIHRRSKLSSDPLTLNIQNYVMNMLTSQNRIKENSLGIPPVQLPGLVSSSKGSPLPASSVFYLSFFFFLIGIYWTQGPIHSNFTAVLVASRGHCCCPPQPCQDLATYSCVFPFPGYAQPQHRGTEAPCDLCETSSAHCFPFGLCGVHGWVIFCFFFFFEESQFHEKDPKPTQKRKTALQNGRGQKGLLVMKQ